jgi:hypothetical protein
VYLQDFHGSAAYNDLDEAAPTGIQGKKVSEIGLGCMRMPDFYGADASSERESIATNQRSLAKPFGAAASRLSCR